MIARTVIVALAFGWYLMVRTAIYNFFLDCPFTLVPPPAWTTQMPLRAPGVCYRFDFWWSFLVAIPGTALATLVIIGPILFIVFGGSKKP